MSLWDTIVGRIGAAGPIYKKPVLSPDQVDKPDDPAPIAAGQAYCRLWLAEMRLAKGIQWFQHRYPLVYSATRYEYAGKQITLPYIAQLDFFKELRADGLDRVVQGARALTPLLPFSRGLIELQAALFSMKGEDPIGRFVGAMSRLSSKLLVPQLSSVMSVIDPVYQGIEDLLGMKESEFKLGFQQTFAPAGSGGSSSLRAGYFAVILADEAEFDNNLLAVVNDSLRIRASATGPISTAKPLSGYDYMLFRLEAQKEQDWEGLTNIKELVEKLQDTILAGKNDTAKQMMDAIRVQILRSPDVVKADRQGMIARIEAEMKAIGLQSSGGPRRSLYAIMQQPEPALDKATREELDQLEEVLA